MKNLKKTVVLASLLSFGFAGVAVAIENQEGGLEYWASRSANFALATFGIVGLPSFGVLTAKMILDLWNEKKGKVSFAFLPPSASLFVLSAWACLKTIENNADTLSGVVSKIPFTRSKKITQDESLKKCAGQDKKVD